MVPSSRNEASTPGMGGFRPEPGNGRSASGDVFRSLAVTQRRLRNDTSCLYQDQKFQCVEFWNAVCRRQIFAIRVFVASSQRQPRALANERMLPEQLPMPVMPCVSQLSYESSVWPTLERGVESLLSPNADAQSHEVLYRAVHNACCCGLAERIETDLLACIVRNSSAIALRLPPRGDGLVNMHDILGPILAVFAYLDREYLSGSLEPCMTQLVLQQMHATPPAATAVPAAPTTGAEVLVTLSEPVPSPAKSRVRRQPQPAPTTRSNGNASKRLRSGSSSAR